MKLITRIAFAIIVYHIESDSKVMSQYQSIEIPLPKTKLSLGKISFYKWYFSYSKCKIALNLYSNQWKIFIFTVNANLDELYCGILQNSQQFYDSTS